VRRTKKKKKKNKNEASRSLKRKGEVGGDIRGVSQCVNSIIDMP